MPRLGTEFIRNVLFVALVVAGVALRIATVVAYRPALLLQRDTLAYLHNAVAANPSTSRFRPALYSYVFLKPLLAFGELVVVTIAQHALGIAIAIAVYLFLVRQGVHRVMASAATVPILLDGYQINIEHYILSETFFDALAVSGLLLLAWWRRRPPITACAVAGGLIAAAGMTRFVGLVLVVPAAIYLLWARAGWLRGGAFIAAFALSLLAYSSWVGGTAGPTGRSGFFLYGRVASFSDCRRVEMPAHLQRYCFDAPPSERAPVYGFWTLETLRGVMDEPETNRELLAFSRRVISRQPLDYTRAVAQDFLTTLAPGPPISKEPLAAKWRFPRTLADAELNEAIVRLGGSAPRHMGFEPFQIRRPLADHLRTYQDVVYTRGPFLALLLALGTVGCIIGDRRSDGINRRGICLLFTASAIALMLSPVMVTVYHFRYSLPALPIAGAAGALGATCVLGTWRTKAGAGTRRIPGDDDSQGDDPVSSSSQVSTPNS